MCVCVRAGQALSQLDQLLPILQTLVQVDWELGPRRFARLAQVYMDTNRDRLTILASTVDANRTRGRSPFYTGDSS